MRSISSALAVNIMIGMWRVAGSLFKILQTSRPGIFGNMRSRMMKAGFSVRALCKPAAPSAAVEITNPPALRKFSVSRSTTSRSSSTIRILLPEAASIRSSSSRRNYLAGSATPPGVIPAFSFRACVNSCKLETICGAFVSTFVASFSA